MKRKKNSVVERLGRVRGHQQKQTRVITPKPLRKVKHPKREKELE